MGAREKRRREECHYTEVYLMDLIIEPHFTEELRQRQHYWKTKELVCSRNNPPHDTVHWCLKVL